jgi:transcriptional regulator with XRE-family HTH domain
MDQAALAAAANVSRNTVVSFESGQRSPGVNNLAAIKAALEAAGAVFLASGALLEGGPGVRLHVAALSPEDLKAKIETIEEQLAQPDPDLSPSPEAGMHQLEKARKQHVVTKLKNRRAKLTRES